MEAQNKNILAVLELQGKRWEVRWKKVEENREEEWKKMDGRLKAIEEKTKRWGEIKESVERIE